MFGGPSGAFGNFGQPTVGFGGAGGYAGFHAVAPANSAEYSAWERKAAQSTYDDYYQRGAVAEPSVYQSSTRYVF